MSVTMSKTKCLFVAALVLYLVSFSEKAWSAEQPARLPVTLLDFSSPKAEAAVVPIDAEIKRNLGKLQVHTRRGAERPGVMLQVPGGRWNLTGFAELETTVKNVGKRLLNVHCAIDSPGADRATRTNCCIESVSIPPGQEAPLKVIIRARVPESLRDRLKGMKGYPGGFRGGNRGTIDPTNVIGISVYVYRPSADQVFEVSNIRAGGRPAFPLPEKLDNLFPMIDCFGQYVHRDWPGKIHAQDELARQRDQEAADLTAHPGPREWNQYGGWLGGPKLEATGRFRVARWRDKWWFVDPEGCLFWSHGLVRVTWSCGYTPITDREHLFADLPKRDSPLGSFFGRSTWPIAGLYPRGTETYNFSGANLLRKYGDSWPKDFADVVQRRFRSWGLNTMANCSQPAIYLQRKTPYTATVYSLVSPPADTPGATGYVATIHNDSRVIEATSGGWGKFPDVFDPSFKATLVREVAQHRGKAVGDPWCLGYFPGNELNWGADETALARAVLASPAGQPAKRALIDELRAKYVKVEKLNAAWKTHHASWEAMLITTAPPAADQGRADLAAFLGSMAEAYFRQCREAVKEIDPEGLYLGCRFAGWSHGQVFRAAARYSDVISVNRYTETLADLRLPEGFDKPVVIGEFHFGALDRGKYHPSLREVANQQARGQAYERYVRSALENPLVVGTHWHQFGDQSTTGRDDGENFQNGFVDVCDTPYLETVEACRRIGYRLYEIRTGQKDRPSQKEK
jgi:hypothetical protein